MTKQYTLITLILTLGIFLVAFNVSCSQSSPRVTPDEVTSIQDEQVEVRDLSTGYRDFDPEIFRLNSYNSSNVFLIELTCGLYCDAHGEMPGKLKDLLDGFMFIWPENTFGDGPVKILNHIPQPDVPADRGNVYYERVDDYEAYIHYISIDWRNSDSSNIIWIPKKRKVYSDWVRWLQAPEDEKWQMLGERLNGLSPEEREEASYERAVVQQLTEIVCNSMVRNGSFYENLPVIVVEGGYYIVKRGFMVLEDAIEQDQLEFNFSVINGEWTYIDCAEGLFMLSQCIRFDPDKGMIGDFDITLDCNENVSTTVTYIDSSTITSEEIDDGRIITKDDVL